MGAIEYLSGSAGQIKLEFVNIYEPPRGGLVDFTDQRLAMKMAVPCEDDLCY